MSTSTSEPESVVPYPINPYQLTKFTDQDREALVKILTPLRDERTARGGEDMIAAFDALALDRLIVVLGGRSDYHLIDPNDPKG